MLDAHVVDAHVLDAHVLDTHVLDAHRVEIELVTHNIVDKRARFPQERFHEIGIPRSPTSTCISS